MLAWHNGSSNTISTYIGVYLLYNIYLLALIHLLLDDSLADWLSGLCLFMHLTSIQIYMVIQAHIMYF